MNQLPGLAIFGLNSLSKVVVTLFQNHGFKIVGLWDTHLEELREYAESNNISNYSTEEDKVLINKDVEMVCIFCSPHLHSQIATKALSIGKHVVCMPPLGLDQMDAKKMVIGAQYYPSLISIMAYSMRYLPSIVQMKKLIEEQALGQILSCEYIILKSMQFTPNNEKEISTKEHMERDSEQDLLAELMKDLHGPHYPNKNVFKDYWISDPWMGGGILNLIGNQAIDLVNFLLNDKILRLHGEVACIKSSFATNPYLDTGRCFDDYVVVNAFYGGQKIRALFVINGTLGSELDKEELIINGSKASLHFDGINFTMFPKSQASQSVTSETITKVNTLTIDTNFVFPHFPKSYILSLNLMIGAVKESFTSCSAGHWAKRSLGFASTFEDGLHLCNVLMAIRTSSRAKSWITTVFQADNSDVEETFKDNTLFDENKVEPNNALSLINSMTSNNSIIGHQIRPRPISYAGHPPLASYHSVGTNQVYTFFAQI